jgi:5'-nucleotidase / UDP-sugar diphosphatase
MPSIPRCVYLLCCTLIVSSVLLLTACKQQSQTPSAAASALIFNMADMHSGYDNYPKLLHNIDVAAQQKPEAALIFVINGDFFEAGSVVASRSKGMLDMAFLKALRGRGEVIFNIGNHDFDVLEMNDFIQQAQDSGIRVIGTFASQQLQRALPPYTDLSLGERRLRFIGVDTDHHATFPASLRDTLTIPNPLTWLTQHYEALAADADDTVLLSHAGLQVDKSILAWLAQQNKTPLYVLGAHDHLSLQTKVENIPYLHTTFKGQRLVLVAVDATPKTTKMTISTLLTEAEQAVDEAFAALIVEQRAKFLTPSDTQIVGGVAVALTLQEAVDWTLDTMLQFTAADVALFNHSSFGSGLTTGPLPRYRFDQFMRFENKLMVANVDGTTLNKILAKANQQALNDIEKMSGDFVYANIISPELGKTYRIVTTDWVASPTHQMDYLGVNVDFQAVPNISIKSLLLQTLAKSDHENANKTSELSHDN